MDEKKLSELVDIAKDQSLSNGLQQALLEAHHLGVIEGLRKAEELLLSK